MKKNLSNFDRGVRVVLAVIFAGLALRVGGPISIVLWLAAIGMAVNAATGFCGLYRIFGINTCKIK